MPKQNVIVEPQARNTAPAIALATAHVAHVDPQGIVIVHPSDQHVSKLRVPGVARRGHRRRSHRADRHPGHSPDAARRATATFRWASRCRAPRGAWAASPRSPTAPPLSSTSCRVSTCGNRRSRLPRRRHARGLQAGALPELSQALDVVRASLGTKKEAAVVKREFPKMPATSIDYGVAEKAQRSRRGAQPVRVERRRQLQCPA